MTDLTRWQGKTAYPKDVATIRQMNRVQDRLDRRVDANKEKILRYQAKLQEQIDALKELVNKIIGELE